MNWKLSPALVTLRRQYNDLYPNRSKASDGTVGDLAHQKTPSDHNPDKNGIVKAFDLTHDPAHGVDCNKESEKVLKDKRVNYVIWNRRIAYFGGSWQPYSGKNPHTKHMHISVNANNYDDDRNWDIEGGAMTKDQAYFLADQMSWKFTGKKIKDKDQEWIAGLLLQGKFDLACEEITKWDSYKEHCKAGELQAKIDKVKEFLK